MIDNILDKNIYFPAIRYEYIMDISQTDISGLNANIATIDVSGEGNIDFRYNSLEKTTDDRVYIDYDTNSYKISWLGNIKIEWPTDETTVVLVDGPKINFNDGDNKLTLIHNPFPNSADISYSTNVVGLNMILSDRYNVTPVVYNLVSMVDQNDNRLLNTISLHNMKDEYSVFMIYTDASGSDFEAELEKSDISGISNTSTFTLFKFKNSTDTSLLYELTNSIINQKDITNLL